MVPDDEFDFIVTIVLLAAKRPGHPPVPQILVSNELDGRPVSWLETHHPAELLEEILREKQLVDIADQLGDSETRLEALRQSLLERTNNGILLSNNRPVLEACCATKLMRRQRPLKSIFESTGTNVLRFTIVAPDPADKRSVAGAAVAIETQPLTSVHEVLMRSTGRVCNHLPAKKSSNRMDGDKLLFNALVDLLQSRNIGWSKDLVSSRPTAMVKAVATAIFACNPQVRHYSRPCLKVLFTPAVWHDLNSNFESGF
jgi:hypothetical protein